MKLCANDRAYNNALVSPRPLKSWPKVASSGTSREVRTLLMLSLPDRPLLARRPSNELVSRPRPEKSEVRLEVCERFKVSKTLVSWLPWLRPRPASREFNVPRSRASRPRRPELDPPVRPRRAERFERPPRELVKSVTVLVPLRFNALRRLPTVAF